MRYKLIEKERIDNEEHLQTHVALMKALGAQETEVGAYILLSFSTLPREVETYGAEWCEGELPKLPPPPPSTMPAVFALSGGELPKLPPPAPDVFKVNVRIKKTVETQLFFDGAFVEDAKALIANLAEGDRRCAFENFYRILARQSLYRAGADAHTE